jgi:hypothetical protein
MESLDLKRCRHCVSPTATIQIEGPEGFASGEPAYVCYRCDRMPHPEDAMFVPPGFWQQA